MSHHNLRSNNLFKSRSVNSVCHGTESVSHLGPKIWDIAPNEIKKSESFNAFKFKSGDGSLYDPCTMVLVYAEYEKYFLGKWG